MFLWMCHFRRFKNAVNSQNKRSSTVLSLNPKIQMKSSLPNVSVKTDLNLYTGLIGMAVCATQDYNS